MKFNKDKFKAKAKKYAPYFQAVVSVTATAVAAYYMRENKRLENELDDPDGWYSISIHPSAMEDIRRGATLKYRQREVRPGHIYAQSTTKDEFSDEATKFFYGDRNFADDFDIKEFPEDPKTA